MKILEKGKIIILGTKILNTDDSLSPKIVLPHIRIAENMSWQAIFNMQIRYKTKFIHQSQ